jgi:Arc/MetJ family transcription regulator
VPVWEREPAVIWQAPEGAIQSNEDLLLGEGRYPAVSSRPDENESDDDGEALDEESSERLDRFIRSLEREAKLRSHCREAYKDAQSVGSCVGLFGSRNGRLFAETIQAEYSTPEFDNSGRLAKLTVQYPYIDIARDVQGAWTATTKIFRRVIDTERDVTFLPGVARVDGVEPVWTEDADKSVTHGFGFCPVVFHKFRLVSSIVNDTDGRAIHATVLDELDAFNIEASIRHDGAVHSLPQRYETGVELGSNPTRDSDQQQLIVYASGSGGNYSPHSPPAERFTNPAARAPQGSRKQGPGYVWQFENENAKVGQLELNAGALTALADTMADLRARVSEALAWVALNPEEIRFAAALSGKALERLMARQLNRVAKDRDGFGVDYLKVAYCMLLRIAHKLGGALRTRGIAKALPILNTFADASNDWDDPPLSLRWGAWFQPVPEDDEKLVTTTRTALEATLITKRTAVEKLSRVFNIENIDAYLEKLEEEKAERDAANAENEAKALASSIAGAHASLNGPTAKPAGPGLARANTENGSGGSDAASDAAKKNGQGKARPDANR